MGTVFGDWGLDTRGGISGVEGIYVGKRPLGVKPTILFERLVPMFRFRIALLAAALIVSAAACTSQPAAPALPRAAPPRMDGTGYGLGSGNKADSDSAHANTATTLNGAAAVSGYGLGSGN